MAGRIRTGRRKNAARGKGAVRPQKGARGAATKAAASANGRGNARAGNAAAPEDPLLLSQAQRPAGAPVPGRLTAPVLVLNLNYVPVNVCTVRRAIVLLAKGKAELLEQRSETARIRTYSAALDAPSIIRLVYLVKRPFAPRRLSKKEVFRRDHYTCQYCGVKSQRLTLDHVVPRRYNGPNTWDNVVAACERCNLDKAGRTPHEANMKLRRTPTAPQPNPYRILENRTILAEWQPYIPWQSASAAGGRAIPDAVAVAAEPAAAIALAD